MNIQRIYPDPCDESYYMDAYLASAHGGFTRGAMVICPGGAYKHLSVFREGEAVAQAFMPYGYNCFVLHYSLSESGKTFPTQLMQAAKTVRYIRQHAEEFRIDPEKVLISGFSAGGHLAASLAVLWDRADVQAEVGDGCRPNGAVLLYPVITASEELGAHRASLYNLLGTAEPTQAMLDEISLEKHVTASAVPAFFMHTTDDNAVGVGNSLAMAAAYSKVGVPFELHVYTGAGHGVALANDITVGARQNDTNPNIARWVELAAAWAKTI